MKFKIQANRSDSLCTNCREGMRIERTNKTIYACFLSHPPIMTEAPVLKCTSYDNNSIPSQYDMEKIAWVVRTDNSGKVKGFQPPVKEKE